MATEPDSPYMPNNTAVTRHHQGNFSLAHTEKRSYWYLELDNGMKELFGSNLSATTNTSFSASVKVSTGSYSELKEYPAIAQGMLFPSNATCPKEGKYETFLTSVGGGSNAFMDKIQNDFFFEVVSSNVVPVLERLVAFFIEPTFATRASSLDPVDRQRNMLAEPVTNTPASQSPDASMAVGTKLTCNLNDCPESLVFIWPTDLPPACREMLASRLVAHIIKHGPLCGTDGSRPNTASGPFLSTAVGGTGLYRNPAGESTLDSCAICRYAACTRAERNSMTVDYGLCKGEVFTIAFEELFMTSTIWDADVKYSFPYDQTNASEDTAGDPIKAAADLD
eukprot:jgi/Chrpa1/26396/Chrysochromulina_OHIO_Genome00028114-RA